MVIWLAQGQEVPQRERHMVESLKMMIMIVWSSIGFHAADVIPRGSQFNPDSSVSIILQRFPDWRVGEVGATDRTLIVHVDNAEFHRAKASPAFIKQKGMKMAPYSPIPLI
jgi:hypothetical protein